MARKKTLCLELKLKILPGFRQGPLVENTSKIYPQKIVEHAPL